MWQVKTACTKAWIVIFSLNFVGHKSILWGHWHPCLGLPVMSFLSFKARIDPLCAFPHLCDPQIHLWCDTYWLCGSKLGSQAVLIWELADHVSTSFDGGSNPWLSVLHVTQDSKPFSHSGYALNTKYLTLIGNYSLDHLTFHWVIFQG